jgi:hypothetical protein
VELDLLAGAGTLALRSAAEVRGDFIFTAGQVNLDGTVAGSVLGSAGDYSKTGTVRGTEDVTLGEPAPAVVEEESARDQVLDQVQRYLGILAVGALLIWLVPRLVLPAAARLRERPALSLGVGALGLVGFVPLLLALLLAIVLCAIPLGMLGLGRVVGALVFAGLLGSASLTFLLILVLLFIAATVVGLPLGRLILDALGQPDRGRYAELAVGALVIVALTAIPIVGWPLQLVVTLLGLGALLMWLWQIWRGRSAPGPLPGDSAAAAAA